MVGRTGGRTEAASLEEPSSPVREANYPVWPFRAFGDPGLTTGNSYRARQDISRRERKHHRSFDLKLYVEKTSGRL